ncbi:MAG TPA: zeta toxin [Cryomorphaceae bacterium]|nr:zeta toxin [Owenweeksia sp.]MBG00095.1 zeta toxin [Owenweeksia sp.]HAD96649.1 zeta toxin [Cryomorphaceae bacterium]HBF21950.1 zeta toxin [Cryomorphaceae bacterium]|tara:strand:+ start:60 stop:635 length:576 start_codon:yes stop_codon:yes gene_type:complete
MKKLFIIAGCNGAGKTTASYTILPEILDCKEFVNADEIARGISPFQPEKVTIQAGRLMLERINRLLFKGENFAFETTLSTRSYTQFITRAKKSGYSVTLLFFWLNSVELAIERVKTRVLEGGHNIPEPVIRRRYANGLKNFFQLYEPIVSDWMFIDNSKTHFKLIAQGNQETEREIIDKTTWSHLQAYGKH